MKIHMLIISLLLFCTSSFAQNGVQILPRETVLDLKWVDGPDEIGLITEAMAYGPDSFLVDEDGTIYILDTIHHRMSVFDNTGKHIRNFPVIGTGETCWGEDGSIYLNYGRQKVILKYSTDGELLEKMEYDLGRIPLGAQIYASDLILRNGDFYVADFKLTPINSSFNLDSRGMATYQMETDRIQKQDSARLKGEQSNSSYLIDNNKYYVESPIGERNLLFTNNLFGPEDMPIFLQEDQSGNVYFKNLIISDRKNRNNDIRELYVFNNNFNIIAKIENMPLPRYTETIKDIFITGTGIVYQMNTERYGVKVYKWNIN